MSTPRWPPPGSTARPCPRAPGPPYATSTGWRPCGCPSPSPSSAKPRLLGVDDTDLKLSDAERAETWALLRSLTESGITVVAVCSEAPQGAVVVSSAPGKDARARADVREAPSPDADPAPAPAPAPDGSDGTDGTDNDDHDHDHDKETADAFAETRRA